METQPQPLSQMPISGWKSHRHGFIFSVAQFLPIVVAVLIFYYSPLEETPYILALFIGSFVLGILLNVMWSIYVRRMRWWLVVMLGLLQVVLAYAFIFISAECSTPKLALKIGFICETNILNEDINQ